MADQPPPVPVLRARSSTPRILPNVDTATKPELLPVPIAPEIMAIEQPAVRVQRRPLPPIPASEADENQDGADEDEPPAGSPDPELRAGDLLLEDLARHRTGALADIVATIQADQDRLVRAPLNIPLVIQGGPGTGKTIVGLHRAAWVLYQQREQMTDQSVLIVGPNRRFIEYISSVLPSLGETAVRQLTIDELALDSLSTVERDRVRIAFLDTREVARVKGDVRMASVIWAAVWLPVVTKELSFGFGRYILRLNEDLVDEIISKIRRRGTPYRDARRELSEALAHAFADEYVRRLGRRGPSASGQELKQLIAEARSHLTTSGDLAGIQPAAEPRSLLRRLYEDPKFLDEVGVILTPTERRLLFRAPTRGPSASAWTAADMALLDEAAACIRGEPRTSGHVVVDEAQDLSPMQWRVLARRTSHASMTIMGDLGQATSPWSPASWTSVIDNAGLTGKAQIAELTLGYRVPKQVMDFAAPLLAIAAPSVTVPKSFRSTEAPLVRRAAASAVPHTTAELARNHQGEGAVAIIAPIGLHERIRTSLGDAGSGVSLLAPEASKGLEFDTVVVVEPEAIAGKTLAGLRLLYVSLTRATTKLIVVHSTTLPGGIGSDKPVTPSSYPNPRNDDPWDNDVVHWLLEQPGGESWTCGVLIECLRRRLSQVTRNPERVDDAARFAKRHGVVQDTAVRGNGSITRLFRTDPLAPTYPSSDADRRRSRGPKAGV
jgi:hypothetical protein